MQKERKLRFHIITHLIFSLSIRPSLPWKCGPQQLSIEQWTGQELWEDTLQQTLREFHSYFSWWKVFLGPWFSIAEIFLQKKIFIKVQKFFWNVIIRLNISRDRYLAPLLDEANIDTDAPAVLKKPRTELWLCFTSLYLWIEFILDGVICFVPTMWGDVL